MQWPEVKQCDIKKEHKAAFHSLDEESNTVLMLATRQNNIEYLSFLLKYGASTWNVNDKGERAVDIAISYHFYDCAILLLQCDSPLPKTYPTAIISDKLSSILSARRQLHEFIKIGNLEGIQDLVTNWEFKVVPNEIGESALLACIKFKMYELFSFLRLNGMRFKSEDEENLLTQNDCNKIKESNKRLAWEVKDAHIISIVSKCTSLQKAEFAKDIENCLRDLNSIEEISPILKALRFSQHVNICFDFENDTLRSLAVCSVAKGWFLPKEYELLMGALELKTNRRSFLGTFIHELTHWALQIVFKNRARPFPADHFARAREFEEVVRETAKCSNLNSIIEGVFKQYESENWDSELIVRVPEMMVYLGVENAVEVLSSQQATKALLSYYTEYVLKDLKAFVLEGNSVKSRETIATLNNEIGTLKSYLESAILFKPEVLIKFHTQLFGTSPSMIVVISKYPRLAYLKVCRALNLERFGVRFNGNILFCEFLELQKRGTEIVSTFYYLNECKYMVLLCVDITDRDYYVNALKLLGRYVEEKPEKRVILIISKSITQLTRQEVKLSSKTILFLNEEGLTLADLTAESQDAILSAELHFQRCKTQMINVLDEDAFHLVDGTVIEKITQSWEIKMENVLSSVNDYPPGFVSLYQNISVNRLIELVDECCSVSCDPSLAGPAATLLVFEGELKCYPTGLLEKLCEVFEVDDLSEKLNNYEEGLTTSLPIPIILYASGRIVDYSMLFANIQSFCRINRAFCMKVKTRLRIYCDLLYSPNLFIQRQLTPEIAQSTLTTSIVSGIKNSNEFIDLIKDSEHRLHVISEKAGMGKSKFLNFVYDALKGNYRAIKISLKDAGTSLEDLPEYELNIDDALNFICSEAGIQDEFSSSLLQSQMLGKSKQTVFLFFDAMDEIPSNGGSSVETNQKKIVSLLNVLMKDTLAKSLVATRPEAERHLAHLTSSPIFHFIPISLDSSRQYLSNICTARMWIFSTDETNYANVVNSSIDKYIDGLKCDFLGNPLHISMLAEVMFEEITKFTRNSMPFESIHQYSIKKLYSEFVEIKYRVCFKEKRNITVDHRVKKRCEFIFQSVALYYLHYGESFCNAYVLNNELFSKAESGVHLYNYEEVAECFDVGIFTTAASQVVTSRKDYRIEFIHRTFAEYFAAKLFLSWMVNQNLELAANLFEGLLLENQYVDEIFDEMLSATNIPDETIAAVGKRLEAMNPFQLVVSLNKIIRSNRTHTIQFSLRCLQNRNKLDMFRKPQMYVGCPVDYQYLLVTAASVNFFSIIKVLLELGFDPNYTTSDADPQSNDLVMEYKPMFWPPPPVYGDEHGIGVMHEIAKKGEVDVIKFIVRDWGGKLDVRTTEGSTLIHFAAASGKVELVQYLEDQGVSIFEANKNKFTSIHFAVKYGRLEMAKWLCRRGLSMSGLVKCGDSLLHLAAKNLQPSLIEWLIDEGACCNSLNDEKATPLIVLSRYPTKREDFFQGLLWTNEPRRALNCVEVLCRRGADLNFKDAAGATVLHHVAHHCSLDGLIMLTDKYNGDVLAKTHDGSTVLHFAAAGFNSSGSREIVPLLKWVVSRGCNVDDRRTSDGSTIIHILVDRLSNETISHLRESVMWTLEQSKNVNATDSNGKGYLYWAYPNSVQLLLSKGCDVNMRDRTGKTAAHNAIDNCEVSVFKVLFQRMLDSNQDISDEFIDYIRTERGAPLPSKYESLIKWIIDISSKKKLVGEK